MKEELLNILRGRENGTVEFRAASDKLSRILAREMLDLLRKDGVSPSEVMVVPILRAGLALLPAFLEVFPDAPVGVLGLERDEETAEARAYYKKFPKELPSYVVVIDPMLATGGSVELAVEFLTKEGISADNIYFTGVIAAQEGFDRLAQHISVEHIISVAVDPELDAQKFIVPGLGDFGDRYFGTQ